MKMTLLLSAVSAVAFAAFGDVVFREDFSDGLSGWEVQNYDGRLSIGVADYAGEKSLRVVMTNEDCDTAWLIRGKTFSVDSGKGISLGIRSRGSTSTDVATLTSRYSSRITFFGMDGRKVVGELPFGYSCSPDEWRMTRWRGTVPAGASCACVQVGLDSPNVKKGSPGIAISSLIVETSPGKGGEWRRDRMQFPPLDPPDGRIAVRGDGVVVANDRPFFPLGLYSVRPCAINGSDIDSAVAELKGAGFNLLHTYAGLGGQRDAVLAAAKRHGMLVMIAPGEDANAKSSPDSEEHVAAMRGNDSLLAWYVGDDTSGHQTVDGLYARRRRLRTLDPRHLTAQADSAWADSYGPFVPCSDVFLPEIYGVKASVPTGREVAEVVRDMAIVRRNVRDAEDGPKSIWPALQQFKGWGEWRRYPTRDELWASAYESIIHGANGLVWYTYSGSKRGRGAKDDPEKWAELCALVSELSAMSDVLASPDASEQPVVTVADGPSRDALRQPSVSCLLKDSPRGIFLMAANAATNDVAAYVATRRGGMMLRLPPLGVFAGPFAPVARREFPVTDFGATDDGRVHTRAIQCAIDAARIAGGGTVVVPRGTYLSGALFFRRGVNLRIEAGGVLKGSTEILDYPLMRTRIEGETCLYFPALVNAIRCNGFTVSGGGVLDGSGGAFWKRLVWRAQWHPGTENKDEQRPRLLYVADSRDVRVEGVVLRNAAFWTTHFHRCDGVTLDGLRIFTETFDGVGGQNPDAVDLDGASRVRIRNVRMDVPNDAVTIKGGKGPDAHDPAKSPDSAAVRDVLIENCTFGPQCTGCLTLGSECFSASNIVMRSCHVEGPVCVLRLKMRPDTLQRYQDVHVSGMDGQCDYAMIVKPYTAHARPEWKGIRLESLARDVSFDVGTLRCVKGRSVIQPNSEYKLENVTCR